VQAAVRSRVPTLDDDRAPARDINEIVAMIASHELENAAGGVVK
jgi:histidine ammonia-lyase